MKIALMQKSFVCADISKNLELILESCRLAQEEDVSLLITPYFSLTGMPLFDLLRHDFLFEEIDKAIQKIFKIKDLAILLSYPQRYQGSVCVCQAVIYNGKFIYQHQMSLQGEPLGNGQEDDLPYQFNLNGLNFSLLYSVQSNHLSCLSNTDIILFQSTEAFYDSIQNERINTVQRIIEINKKPVLMINPLGANDQYLYEAGSFALDKRGEFQFKADYFKDEDYLLTWDSDKGLMGTKRKWYEERIELLYHAIIFSMQEYFRKNHFQKICLGLSGGIDSALVLALSCQAIGAGNCEVFLMPSQYTSDMSNDLAAQMAEKLQVTYSIVPISGIFKQSCEVLASRFQALPEDTTEENIQARIRGVLLMALSNKTGAILLCTGNKSEEAVGYCTLYGDTNGGFAPIKDLYKTEVYAMARWINKTFQDEIIPQGIIDRTPSAELKENQSDQDSLPEYEILDKIIQLILQNKSAQYIIQQGHEQEIVYKVMKLIRNSEFKRQQGVLGPKISERSFGREWNYPITHLSNHF
ncbi:NAD+ synthase [Neisseriaceae bacterium PsAf]|nr:NAD+ synthase [Neisseriaceae bacterium PsAf]MCV2502709.1 NAD+ synthase [Neisseriaceae bacterium]